MKKFIARVIVAAMLIATLFTSAVPAQAASFPSFDNLTVSNVTTCSARVDFTLKNPGRQAITQVGIEIKDATTSKWVTKTDYVSSTYKYAASLPCWYIIGAGKEVNITLKPGRYYEYRVFCVIGGAKSYTSRGFWTKSATTTNTSNKTSGTLNTVARTPYYTNIRFTTLTHNNARIDFNITNPSGVTITNAGIQIRKAGTSYFTTKTDTISASYRNRTTIPSWYIIGSGKEVNLNLQPSTKYEYRLFYVWGGKTYATSLMTFTTKSNPAQTNKSTNLLKTNKNNVCTQIGGKFSPGTRSYDFTVETGSRWLAADKITFSQTKGTMRYMDFWTNYKTKDVYGIYTIWYKKSTDKTWKSVNWNGATKTIKLEKNKKYEFSISSESNTLVLQKQIGRFNYFTKWNKVPTWTVKTTKGIIRCY